LAGKKGNIEIYSAGRYLTVTGHRLKNAPETIEPRQEQIDQLFKDIFPDAQPARFFTLVATAGIALDSNGPTGLNSSNHLSI
jgi:hypothetical protein